MTEELCFNSAYNDLDQDGVGDFCEEQIAFAFRPELAYWHGDLVGREPYWAGMEFGAGVVRIAYLLSYYIDDGVDSPLCPSWPDLCAGHYGDSEWILLDIAYVQSTQHWILRVAYYSEHNGFNFYGQSPKGYPMALVYPDRNGGYPRSYVAISKHAN